MGVAFWEEQLPCNSNVLRGADTLDRQRDSTNTLVAPPRRREPVRSIMRDCYSFCRFAVLAGEPLDGQNPPGSVREGGEEAQQQKQQEQQEHDSGQGEEFVAAVLADDDSPAGAADAAAASAADVDQLLSQQGQQAKQPGAHDPGPAPDVGAAIWALHPCSQASAQHPPALLAIPGGDERTAEVVCCSCGKQVAEFREEAAGRKLGMVMAVQLYCPPEVPPAAPDPARAAAAPHPSICLAAGYEDGSVAVWQLGVAPHAPPRALHTLCREPVMALAVDCTGAGGAAGSAEDQVVVFRLDHAAGRVSVRHSIEVQRKGIGDVAVRPDRRLLATAGWDGRVRVYKYRSGRPLAILKVGAGCAAGDGGCGKWQASESGGWAGRPAHGRALGAQCNACGEIPRLPACFFPTRHTCSTTPLPSRASGLRPGACCWRRRRATAPWRCGPCSSQRSSSSQQISSAVCKLDKRDTLNLNCKPKPSFPPDPPSCWERQQPPQLHSKASMVLVVASRGLGPGPARCQALPAPRSVASCWEEAAKAHQGRLTLPLFSLRDGRQPWDLQPVFQGFQAALQLDLEQWALCTAFQELSRLGQGSTNALNQQLQPQLLDQEEAAATAGAVPAFLLLTARTPHMNGHLRLATATVDVPILPGPDAEQALCQARPEDDSQQRAGPSAAPARPVPSGPSCLGVCCRCRWPCPAPSSKTADSRRCRHWPCRCWTER